MRSAQTLSSSLEARSRSRRPRCILERLSDGAASGRQVSKMPDFRAYLRQNLPPLGISDAQEAEIVGGVGARLSGELRARAPQRARCRTGMAGGQRSCALLARLLFSPSAYGPVGPVSQGGGVGS